MVDDQGVRPTGPNRCFKILLVEGEPLTRKLILAVLEASGYSADVAANGQEAVEALDREGYDLVLMDMQMPELDGIQATRLIRALPPPRCHARIVALTAGEFATSKKDFLAAGIDEYVLKPFGVAALLDIVQKAERLTDR